MKSTHLRGIAYANDEFREAWRVILEAPFRALWGAAVILLGLAGLGVFALMVSAGSLVWNGVLFVLSFGARVRAVWRFADQGNPFRYAMNLVGCAMWRVVYPAAGIRVELDTSAFTPFAKGEIVKAYVVHPSYAGVPPVAHVLSVVLPHLWCIPMKHQMMHWPIGWAVWAIRMGIPIPREHPQQAVERIAQAAQRGYSVAIMPEGTRPTPRSVAKTVEELKRRGLDEAAATWRHTSCPLPSGARAIERALPNARRILILFASSFDERGIAGLLRLIVRRGQLVYRVVDWDGWSSVLAAGDPSAFSAFLRETWQKVVHPWIDHIRIQETP